MSHQQFSPLHARHVMAGAVFTELAGWQVPERFGAEPAGRDEHLAVRRSAGLFDLAHMAVFSVRGIASGEMLDVAFASALSELAIGEGAYTLMLSEIGTVLDDVVVFRRSAQRYSIIANAVNQALIWRELQLRSARFAGVTLRDLRNSVTLVALQGPAAERVLSDVDALEVPAPLRTLGNYRCWEARFLGHPVFLARASFTGEDGFELGINPVVAAALWDALFEAGAPHGLVRVGLAARDSLRLEAGMPRSGRELSNRLLPVQSGLAWVLNKAPQAPFIGAGFADAILPPQEPVLVGLVGDSAAVAPADATVFAGECSGVRLGHVTSSCFSPMLQRPIAFALLSPDQFGRRVIPGDAVWVDVRDARVVRRKFTVARYPFYRRHNAAP